MSKLTKIKKFIPSRKALAGGLAGIVAFFISIVFPDIADGTAEQLVGALATAIAAIHLIPESKVDLIKKADLTIKALEDKHGETIDALLAKVKDPEVKGNTLAELE